MFCFGFVSQKEEMRTLTLESSDVPEEMNKLHNEEICYLYS
jgi:hypothetical protein